jgi:crotonobetainyl-CoA:carnitine CoA-transferase CaiB-like acyl-CoA transferase
MPGPLEGVKVLDVSAVVSGPLATMILADQGAEVVKVEPTGTGDVMRQKLNHRGGMSAFFANCNRGKRSVAVDLKQERGVEVVKRLAREADVLVQNWRPGAAERLGLGEAALRALNPKLIYASISGFGDSGPYRDRPVYDPILQGLTGHVAIQESPDIPIKDLVRNIVSDKSSAYTMAQAISAALFARERGAGGQSVHVPMIDASLAFFWPDGMMKHTLLGEDVENPGALYEIYRIWPTADGHLIYFAASPKETQALYRALGHPEWQQDERFIPPGSLLEENREVLGRMIMGEIEKRNTADLVDAMVREEVPVGPVHSIESMLEDPQVRHNDRVYEEDHPDYGRFRAVRPAARFSATPQQAGAAPPLLGEHTDEVLRELGFAPREVAALRESGVVG